VTIPRAIFAVETIHEIPVVISVLLPQCFPRPSETTVKLDSKTVNAVRLDGKTDQIFFDDTLPGFGYRLRLSADGKVNANWIAQYRSAGGTRRVLIGAAAKCKAAKKILAAVALGDDPQADRRDRRNKDQHTVRSVVAEYLAAKEPEVRRRTLVETRRYLSTGSYFRPLHAMPIDTVTRKHIASCLVAISRKNGSVTAARARASLSAFFTWAMQAGLTDMNPVIGAIQPKDSEGRERVLSDAELAAVWRASGDDEYGRIMKLLILTGARRAEIGGLRWSELDTDTGAWTLPSERSKNKHAHTLPLPAAPWDIINSVPRRAHRDQLFGILAEEGFTTWGGGKIALDDRLLGKMTEPWVAHDIRRTVATKMADIGVQPHIIEQVLNHQGGHKRGVAGIYNRSSYDREVRAALALWAEHVAAIVEGRKPVVVPLKTA
jgi:integrase